MTTAVIDSLKAHTYGLKRSIQEKEPSINNKHERGQRYYPASQAQGVDQWSVFPRKIEEFNQQVSQNQKVYKSLVKDELKNQYQRQFQQKQQRNNQAVKEKDSLGQKIRQEDQQYQQMQDQANKEVRNIRKLFDQQNQQMHSYQKESVKNQTSLAKHAEASRLLEVQESLRLEQQKRRDKLDQFRNDVKTLSGYVEMKKNMEKGMSGMQQEADKQNIQSYIDNQIRRNQAYNQHFENVNQVQKYNQEKYINAISQDLQKKYSSIRRENQDVQKYNKYQAEKARALENQRLQMINGCYTDNRSTISNREYDMKNVRSEEEKRNLQLRNALRKDWMQNQNRIKEQKKRQQLLYRQTLDRQKQTQQYDKRLFGNMSKVEKEMNRVDLRTYKKHENVFNCMIPGIKNIPSVGSQPTRGGDNLIKIQQQINASGSLQNLESPHRSIGTAKTAASAIISPSNIKGGGMTIGSDQKKRLVQQRMSQSSIYNPITNPMPRHMQNPVIYRQSQQLLQKQSHFTNYTPSPVGNVSDLNIGLRRQSGGNALQHAGAQLIDRSL